MIKRSYSNKLKKFLYFGIWIKNININKKFKDIISIKSQLHQPPQLNSCSAHQEPKNIENNNINVDHKYCSFFKKKNLLKNKNLNFKKVLKYIKYNNIPYDVYSIIGCIINKPFNKFLIILKFMEEKSNILFFKLIVIKQKNK